MLQKIINAILHFFKKDSKVPLASLELETSNAVDLPPVSLEALEIKYNALETKNLNLSHQLESNYRELRALQLQLLERFDKTNEQTRTTTAYATGNERVSYGFHSEVMVTAGPRKKPGDDVDFGEDSCGLVHMQDKVLFWLLDGVSNQDKQFLDFAGRDTSVEMFSSRLMVQSIARTLPRVFAENKTLDAQELTDKTITKVANDWVDRYKNYKAPIMERGSLKCATTMIVGILDIEGQLDAYVIGDASLLLFDHQKKFKECSKETKEQQVFVAEVEQGGLRLFTSRQNRIRVQGGVSVGEHLRKDKVFSILCHSDGISERRSQKIREKSQEGFAVVREALSKIPVNTQDDKSLLIIELKNI
ncbi:MAG: protein phosphatase 2C domain-containing protein [Bacteroidota bacterium]